MVTGDGQMATPLVLSEHLKLTVTLELFHPVAFGGGLMTPEMLGKSSSTPTISRAIPLPGGESNLMINRSSSRRLTFFWLRQVCRFYSFGPTVWTPFRNTNPLALANSPFGPALL